MSLVLGRSIPKPNPACCFYSRKYRRVNEVGLDPMRAKGCTSLQSSTACAYRVTLSRPVFDLHPASNLTYESTAPASHLRNPATPGWLAWQDESHSPPPRYGFHPPKISVSPRPADEKQPLWKRYSTAAGRPQQVACSLMSRSDLCANFLGPG